MAQKKAMMRGATSVRKNVIDHLEATLPGVIEQARVDWELTEYQLPLPVKYDAYEPIKTNIYPHVAVNILAANNFGRVDYDAYGSTEYQTKYSARVFMWVRTPVDVQDLSLEPSFQETARCRDDLATCLRVTLLRSETLGSDNITWDERSLEESYSAMEALSGNKYAAAVVLSFSLQYDESVALTSDYTVETIGAQAELIR